MKNSLLCNHMEYSAEGQIPIVFQTIGSYKKFYSYFHFRGKNFEAPSGTALLAAQLVELNVYLSCFVLSWVSLPSIH